MKLVDELFKRHVVNVDTLASYGFLHNHGVYTYKKDILNGDFALFVTIKDGIISAKLLDNEFDDEYNMINVEDASGGFLATLKDECSIILIEIRDHCFRREYFIGEQTNRLTYYIINKYNSSPEFLWDDDPDYGVFRNKNSNKWFGIIMNIKRDRLIQNSEGFVEVINLKLDDKVTELLLVDGIYPAYHMNKKYWVSLLLDDTLSDKTIFDLVDISFSLSQK